MSRHRHVVSAELRERLNARFYGPLMSFFTRRLPQRSQAEDLTQETLLRVIAAQDSQDINHAEGYVFKVAMNLLRDQQRLRAKVDPQSFVQIDEASEFEHQLVEEISPERVLASKESLSDVLRTLAELGERTRDIFVLFRLENMKQKEIAALLGIGQSTVEKHVMRAVLHLATRYGGQKLP